MLAGTWATAGLLELSVIVNPPGGASVRYGSVTYRIPCVPDMTVRFDAENVIGGAVGEVTVTFAVMGANPAEVPVIVAEPASRPVTKKPIPLVLAGIVTLAGTWATSGLLDCSAIVNPPAGAGGPDSVTNKACAPPVGMVRFDDEKAIVCPVAGTTVTLATIGAKPEAVPVIIAEPGSRPVTKKPIPVVLKGIVTLAGTWTDDVLLDCSATVTPPTGAGPDSTTNSSCCPPPDGTVRLGVENASVCAGAAATVTLVEIVAKLGLKPIIVAVPASPPVT